MIYDFNKPVDRRKEHATKYEKLNALFGREDLLPFWIADMDLETAPEIKQALADRVATGIYGYTYRPESYFQAVADWQKKRNGWDVDPAAMSFCFGVIQAVVYFIKHFSKEGEEILFLTPAYNNFFQSVESWGRKVLSSSLLEENGYYTIDFSDLEEKLKREPKLFIMCNPHNPVGRAWTREELTRVAELCHQYHVPIFSDEIHSDLILEGYKHIPMATLDAPYNHVITGISPSKTFNLAGVQAATVVFPDASLKEGYDQFWDGYKLGSNSAFSQVIVEAAFTQGEDWLEQLLVHIRENMLFVQAFLQEHTPNIKVTLPESTYLLWLDCREMGLSQEELKDFFINDARLALNSGTDYGPEGEGFMRLNVACPRPMLEQGMKQLSEGYQQFYK